MTPKTPVCPDRIRSIPEQFSWVDHRLVRDRYIDRLTHKAAALYLFLATVADAKGPVQPGQFPQLHVRPVAPSAEDDRADLSPQVALPAEGRRGQQRGAGAEHPPDRTFGLGKFIDFLTPLPRGRSTQTRPKGLGIYPKGLNSGSGLAQASSAFFIPGRSQSRGCYR